MAMLRETSCCGLDEIEDLGEGPEQTLLDVCEDKYGQWGMDSKQAFLLFSDAVKYGNGPRLAKYITDNNLGVVYATTRARMNPNSGNNIKVWVWGPNERALRAWWKKNRSDKW